MVMRMVKMMPEERERRKKNKKLAKRILVKTPLVLWVLFAIAACCITPTDATGFLSVLLVTGVFVIPWLVVCNFIIEKWN